MGKPVLRLGNVYGNLKVTKDINGEKFECTCEKCGKSDLYYKKAVITGMQCKHCGFRQKLIERTGEVFGKMKILEELGGRKVKCECIKCHKTMTKSKGNVVKGNVMCDFCDIVINLKSYVGEIHRELKITKELGNNKVICECVKCGVENEYNKSGILREKLICKNCGVNKATINRVGEVHGTLKITKELGKSMVKCVCQRCNSENEYDKGKLLHKGLTCKVCSLKENYKDKIINDIKVLNFMYKGRDKLRYFECVCIKCGEILLLNEDEIPRFRCE